MSRDYSIPPTVWKKTTFDDLGVEPFKEMCLLKAKITNISLLTEEHQRQYEDGSLADHLLNVIMEDAYAEIEWLPRDDLPEELQNMNPKIVRNCVYDCGLFKTTRIPDGEPSETDPLIYGFWNNPWMAFCCNDIVLIIYDPVKGNRTVEDRLLLVGHSSYEGVGAVQESGKDNDFIVPRVCGLESYMGVSTSVALAVRGTLLRKIDINGIVPAQVSLYVMEYLHQYIQDYANSIFINARTVYSSYTDTIIYTAFITCRFAINGTGISKTIYIDHEEGVPQKYKIFNDRPCSLYDSLSKLVFKGRFVFSKYLIILDFIAGQFENTFYRKKDEELNVYLDGICFLHDDFYVVMRSVGISPVVSSALASYSSGNSHLDSSSCDGTVYSRSYVGNDTINYNNITDEIKFPYLYQKDNTYIECSFYRRTNASLKKNIVKYDSIYSSDDCTGSIDRDEIIKNHSSSYECTFSVKIEINGAVFESFHNEISNLSGEESYTVYDPSGTPSIVTNSLPTAEAKIESDVYLLVCADFVADFFILLRLTTSASSNFIFGVPQQKIGNVRHTYIVIHKNIVFELLSFDTSYSYSAGGWTNISNGNTEFSIPSINNLNYYYTLDIPSSYSGVYQSSYPYNFTESNVLDGMTSLSMFASVRMSKLFDINTNGALSVSEVFLTKTGSNGNQTIAGSTKHSSDGRIIFAEIPILNSSGEIEYNEFLFCDGKLVSDNFEINSFDFIDLNNIQ